MRTAKPGWVVLHAMWISIVITIPVGVVEWLAVNIASTGPQWRQLRQAGAAVVLLAPFWVPVLGLGGALIGLAAAGGHRLARRRPGWQLASGTLAGGLLGVALLAPVVRAQPLNWLIGATIGTLCGGLALVLARRTERTTGSGWGAGVAVLAAATGVAASYQTLMTGPWDPDEDCAARLGVPEAQVTAITSEGFPQQTWCVSLDAVQPFDTSWTASVVGLLATATLVCALIAVSRWGGAWQRTSRTVVAAAVLTGVAGSGLALWWPTVPPSASQLDQARAELRSRPTTAPPGPRPIEIHAADALHEARRLGRLARTAAGPTVLWPKRLVVTEEACRLDSGAPGVRVLATASFTAKDLAKAHSPQQMAALERANEHIADSIADAWRASGVLASADQVHGEWWFGAQPSQALQTAHIGFTEGIGMLHASSDCVSR